jgi:hypothetical protein
MFINELKKLPGENEEWQIVNPWSINHDNEMELAK